MSLESAMAAATTATTEATPAQADAAPKAPETPVTPPAEPPKETASAILAKLAREKKERLNLSKQVTAKDSEKAQLEARIKELEGKVSAKPKNPIDALMAAGYSYKDATDFVLNNQAMTAEQQVKAVQDEIAEMKREQTEREESAKKTEAERMQAQYDRAIAEFKDEISDFVESNKEKYELTHIYGGQELIYETIAAAYQKSLSDWEESGRQGRMPRVLSKEEAAELVEKHYEEEVEKLQKIEKIKKKFGHAEPASEVAKPGAPAQASKTLSHAATSAPAPQGGRIQDPIARAMAALEKLGK